jgi:hypothetical protein
MAPAMIVVGSGTGAGIGGGFAWAAIGNARKGMMVIAIKLSFFMVCIIFYFLCFDAICQLLERNLASGLFCIYQLNGHAGSFLRHSPTELAQIDGLSGVEN